MSHIINSKFELPCNGMHACMSYTLYGSLPRGGDLLAAENVFCEYLGLGRPPSPP